MATLQQVPSLTPLALSYVPDNALKEGRVIIPLALDFSKNQQIDQTNTFYTSAYQVQTANVKSVRVLSAIKGLAIKFNTYNNQVLKITCAETGQSWVVGVPFQVTPGNFNFTVNARIPMFLPQNATLNFINYALATDPPSVNNAVVQLCNFEVTYATAVVGNPFGNSL